MLVQEIYNSEHPIYFSSNVFKAAELRYQKIESLAFVVVITTIKLRPCFMRHMVMVKKTITYKKY